MRTKVLVLTPLAWACAAAFAQTLPSGGQVVQGSGSVLVNGTAMTVNQTSQRLIADWQSFSIGAGNTVRFVQPSSSSVALNRVLGADPSRIFGSLSANGHVYLQNPNGVYFAPGAQVDVGSLVATTLNADAQQFMAGRLRLSGDPAGTATVVTRAHPTTPAAMARKEAAARTTNRAETCTVRRERTKRVERPLQHPERVRSRGALHFHVSDLRRVHAHHARRLGAGLCGVVGPNLERTHVVEDERQRFAPDACEQRKRRRRQSVVLRPIAVVVDVRLVHALDPVAGARRMLANQTARHRVAIQVRVQRPHQRAIRDRRHPPSRAGAG